MTAPLWYNAASSSDPFPGGSVTTYRWTWGDGTVATGSHAAHRFTRTGTYTVTLNGTDNFQRTAAASQKVKVAAASGTVQTLSSRKVRKTSRVKTTVRVSAIGATPTGTVTIFDGAKTINHVVMPLSAHGGLTITLPKFRVGVHTILARYSGSAYVAGSAAEPVKLKVTQ